MNKLIPELIVESVDESVNFYQKYLNFEVIKSVNEGKCLTWAWMRKDNVELMFYSRKNGENEVAGFRDKKIGATIILVIRTKEIEEIFAKVKNGVKMESELQKTDYGTKEFKMFDNSGYLIQFLEDIES